MSFYIGEPGASCHSLHSSDICYVYFCAKKYIYVYVLYIFSKMYKFWIAEYVIIYFVKITTYKTNSNLMFFLWKK